MFSKIIPSQYINVNTSQYIWCSFLYIMLVSSAQQEIDGVQTVEIPAYFLLSVFCHVGLCSEIRRYWVCCCKQSHSAFEHLKVKFEFMFASLFAKCPEQAGRRGTLKSEQPGFKSRLLSFLSV